MALRLYGRDVKTIARLAGVSRNSLYRFLSSDRYQTFRIYMEGEPLIEEVLKEWDEFPVEDAQRVNEMTLERIIEKIKEELQKLMTSK